MAHKERHPASLWDEDSYEEEPLSPIQELINYIYEIAPSYFGRLGDGVAAAYIAVSGARMDDLPSIAAGAIMAALRVPAALPKKSVEILSRVLSDGFIKIDRLPNGRITASLVRDLGNSQPIIASVSTCPLFFGEGVFCVLGVRWDGSFIDVSVDANTVGSTDPNTILPSNLFFSSEKRDDGASTAKEDFSKQSAVAQIKRRGKVTGAHPEYGRKPGSKERDFRSLGDEVAQLTDLAALVRGGKLAHARGIGTILRKLLIGQSGHIGLLQRCAGRINESLTVYTVSNPSLLPPFSPYEHLALALSAEPTGGLQNPVDIDIWLGLVAGRTNGRNFSHFDIIKAIGNTVSAHSDPDIHPIVSMLETLETEVITGHRHDFIVSYILGIGDEIMRVSEILIAKDAENG